jgi:hypothetical protein
MCRAFRVAAPAAVSRSWKQVLPSFLRQIRFMVPLRGPGPGHPAPHHRPWRAGLADRGLLRHHQPGLPPRRPGAPWQAGTRPVADRKPPALGPRRVFDEDHSQIRQGHGPQVMATFRNLTVSLLRRAGHHNVARGLRWAARDTTGTRALGLLGLLERGARAGPRPRHHPARPGTLREACGSGGGGDLPQIAVRVEPSAPHAVGRDTILRKADSPLPRCIRYSRCSRPGPRRNHRTRPTPAWRRA